MHVIIDGVDECARTTQQDILRALSEIQRASQGFVKVLISSRLERHISEPLPTNAHISLNGQTDRAVQLYIGQKVQEIRDFFPDISKTLLDRIERRMLDLARGMFLWVYLVTAMLKDQATEYEVEQAAEQLPEGIDAVYGRILCRLTSLKEPVRSRAYRILSWSCAASRPVKVQEVADGVALQPGHASVLNEKTRIRNTERSIVDVCAPLVEKTPAGYLEIVHFSAKEYLLHLQSGPFIDIAQSHFDVGVSCLLSLIASFVVLPRLSPDCTTSEIETQMVRGYFGLQPYAHKFWASHVRKYFNEISGAEKESVSPASQDPRVLINLLQRLSCVQKGYVVPHDHDLPLDWAGFCTGSIILSQFPRISSLIQKWEDFQNHTVALEMSGETVEDQVTSQLHQDPTYLSLIAQRICSIKEDLLKLDLTDLPDHIKQEEFMAFKEELGVHVFECRYRTCNHCSKSIQLRLEHEKSHKPSFPCLYCDLSGKGFKSRRDLENHVKQYHSSDKEVNIPKTLSSMASHHAPLPFRDGGHWNEKGRKALQRTFIQVYKALAPSEPPLGEDECMNVTSNNKKRSSSGGPNTVYSKIGEKIELQQYQSLKEFKEDLTYCTRSVKRLKSVDDRDSIQVMLDGALTDAAKAFPGFACSTLHDPSHFNVASFSVNGLEMASENGTSLFPSIDAEIDQSQPQMGCKSIFWSKLEDDELPRLLKQHRGDFHAIADYLMTKTAEDVEARFQALVQAGQHDLETLVHSGGIELSAGQQEEGGLPAADPLSLSTITSIALDDSSISHSQPSSAVARPQFTTSNDHNLVPGDFSSQQNLPVSVLSEHESLSRPLADLGDESCQVAESSNLPKKYERNKPPPAFCELCTPGQNQFRDDSTLNKHKERAHAPLRKVWVCIDVSMDRTFLSKQWKTWNYCLSCRGGKRYSSKHNAATHLRRMHFGPATSMENLMRWMEEIQEPNPNHRGYSFIAPPIVSIRTALMRAEATPRCVDDDDENVDGLASAEVSFDDILRDHGGSIAQEGDAISSPTDSSLQGVDPRLAMEGFIRVEHVDRLPNLSEYRKAVTRDQVIAYYETLNELKLGSQSENYVLQYEDDLVDLKRLSQTLRQDFINWQRDLSTAELLVVLKGS